MLRSVLLLCIQKVMFWISHISRVLSFLILSIREVVRGLACSNDAEGYAGRSVKLLVGSPKPDRPKVMGQTKRDTPAL
jgi:hypothetical protein